MAKEVRLIDIPKGFWHKLGRHNNDFTTMLVIADWCDDHDDPEQAKAWRWLAKHKKIPAQCSLQGKKFTSVRMWFVNKFVNIAAEATLPQKVIGYRSIKGHLNLHNQARGGKNYKATMIVALKRLVATKWVK